MPFVCTNARKQARQGEGAGEVKPSSPPLQGREREASLWV